jgi:hypothetical protein
MSNVLSVTAPIYLLILVGYVAVWLEWMVATDLRVLGRFVAQFCVPALLFRALSRQPFAEVLHGDYVAVYAGGSLVALATVTVFARFVRGRSMSLAALQGLGSSGSNSSFVGYPIVEQLIGPTAGVALAMCTLVENLIVMPLALAMADSEGGGGRPRDALMAALRGLVRNPMILAILAGLALSASGLHLPSVLDRTVAIAAAAAPPTALFVIGGSLVGLRLAGIRGDLALVTFGKLAFHPLCVLGFMLVLNRLRLCVEALNIPSAQGDMRFTISAGVARHLPGQTVADTVARADQALYRAKAGGRNRVESASEDDTPTDGRTPQSTIPRVGSPAIAQPRPHSPVAPDGNLTADEGHEEVDLRQEPVDRIRSP